MSNKQIIRSLALCLFLLPVMFTACVKDTCKKELSYTYFVPIYKTKQQVREMIHSSPAREILEPGKIYVKGGYIYLNEINKGIHIIDNRRPSAPRNIAFIDIPGNLDIAIKDNSLYADMYTDVVTLDIEDPTNVQLKKVNESIFPTRYYGNGFAPDDNAFITEWVRHDTTIMTSCDRMMVALTDNNVFYSTSAGLAPGAFSASSASPIGVSGSMARFTISSDRLYAVSDQSLEVFNIASSNDPLHTNSLNLNWGIETVYPFRNKLFIGSQSGMFVYDLTDPDHPQQSGTFNHARTCDPVIADEQYAYVTLRSGSECAGYTNELDIIDATNLSQANSQSLLKRYDLVNPHGLTKVGNNIYICDGEAGLKIYDAADVMNLQLIASVPGHDAVDVIPQDDRIIVTGKDGLYQYDITQPSNPVLLSHFELPVK